MSDFAFPPPRYNGSREAGPPPGQGPGALSGPDPKQSLEEIARLLGPGATTGLHAQPGLSTPGLDAPLVDCAPEDMIAFIGAIIAKTQDSQLRTARTGIDVSQRKLDERHTAAMAKINEWIRKTKDADSNSGPGGVFGFMKRFGGPAAAVIGIIVSVAAIIATAGTITPLMVGFLALTVVASSVALAGQIAQEAGYDKPLDVSHWLAKGFTTMLTDEFGVSEEDAAHGGKLLSGAIPVLALLDPKILGNLAGGIAGFAGADETDLAIIEGTFAVVATVAVMVLGMGVSAGKVGKAADAAEEASRLAKGADGAADGAADGVAAGAANAGNAGKAARLEDLKKSAQALGTQGRIVQGGMALSNGTAAIGSGAIDAMKAGDQRDAAMAQADKQKIQATILLVQRQLDEQRDIFRKLMDEMSNVTVVVSDVLSNAASTRSQIASASPHQPI